MKIKSIHVYSHDGRRRDLQFKDGLNIITGRSSTGKSALSEIIEYCMGNPKFKVPEGVIRDKVSWFSVVYQFQAEQVLIAKPTPSPKALSQSLAMMRRGTEVSVPTHKDLELNTDDAAVTALLSSLLGIPENRTEVSEASSRVSFPASVKHTLYYLFQKQGLIANKDQLFYRQHEPHIPQTIKDTFPILFGIDPPEKFELETKLRRAKRNLILSEKRRESLQSASEAARSAAIPLYAEAQEVGLLRHTETSTDIIEALRSVTGWTPEALQNSSDEGESILALETDIKTLRQERRQLQLRADSARKYATNAGAFEHEVMEQRERLASIEAFPKKTGDGTWQWPLAEENLGLESSVASALLTELKALDRELEAVNGERPKLEGYIAELDDQIDEVAKKTQELESELASRIEADEILAELRERSLAQARVVGRVSHFVESLSSDSVIADEDAEHRRLQSEVDRLAGLINLDERDEVLTSVLNLISYDMTRFIRELNTEFSEFPARLDLKNLTVVIDRPTRPIWMERSGGGENHLAYHVAALLALHLYASKNDCSIPSFLLVDQPTQVYFPSEERYKATDGSIEQTEESDADLKAVRRLFGLFQDFVDNENPGFQLIITEHANLPEQWFQDALVEQPWTKPPALVPDEWPISSME